MWSIFSDPDWGISDADDDVRSPVGFYGCEGPSGLGFSVVFFFFYISAKNNELQEKKTLHLNLCDRLLQPILTDCVISHFFRLELPLPPSSLPCLKAHCLVEIRQRRLIRDKSRSNNNRAAFSVRVELLLCHCPQILLIRCPSNVISFQDLCNVLAACWISARYRASGWHDNKL